MSAKVDLVIGDADFVGFADGQQTGRTAPRTTPSAVFAYRVSGMSRMTISPTFAQMSPLAMWPMLRPAGG